MYLQQAEIKDVFTKRGNHRDGAVFAGVVAKDAYPARHTIWTRSHRKEKDAGNRSEEVRRSTRWTSMWKSEAYKNDHGHF